MLTLDDLIDRINNSKIRDKELASLEMQGWYSSGTLSSRYNNSRWTRVLRTIIPEAAEQKSSSEPWFNFLKRLEGLKKCSKCSEWLPLPLFGNNSREYLGIQTYCRNCSCEIQAKYTSELSEEQSAHKHSRSKLWYEENRSTPHYKKLSNARGAKRRSAKLQRTPPWSEIEDIQEFYMNCPESYHVDHIIPLQGNMVSGLHVLSNLQYLTAEENLKKGNKFNE